MYIRCLFFVISMLLINNYVFAAKRVIRIGSGSILKNYYSIGLDLCKTIKLADENIECEVVATNGSVDNLELLKRGKIDFALIQANIAVEAFNGIGYFAHQEKMSNLRQVLNLYDEFFTVIVKDDDKVKVFQDIDGKKISNGPPFSSSNITYDALRKLYNFTKEPIDIEVNYTDYAKEFCSGKIDVLMMMVGHPNALVSLIANQCEIDFVAIENSKINQLIKENKAFHRAILHKNLYYPGITEDQNTIAVSAILITNANMDYKLLDKFIGKFHKNINNFRHSDNMLSTLDINYFADTKNFVLPKHKAVRNRE